MLRLSPTLNPVCTPNTGIKLPPKRFIRESKTQKISNTGVSVRIRKGKIGDLQNSNLGTKITPNSLSQNEIDICITSHFQEIKEYTEKAIHALKRNIDATTLISEGYLHIHKCRSDLHSEADVISYYKNFIKMNLRWSNSPIIRSERAILIDCTKRDLELSFDSPPEQLQEWISTWESLLKNEEARLWNIWYHRNLRKGREIAEHLDISISGSYSLIKECKLLEQALRNYIVKKLV